MKWNEYLAKRDNLLGADAIVEIPFEAMSIPNPSYVIKFID